MQRVRYFACAAIASVVVGALFSLEGTAMPLLRRTTSTHVANVEADHRLTAAPRNGCHNNPCKHGAACTKSRGSDAGYMCACSDGYTGHNCEINVDGCASYVCAHGGLCVDGVNGPVCMCVNGFAGDKCEIYPNPCAATPCQNGGTCNPELATASEVSTGEKWCITKERAMCVKIHWTFPEESSKEECSARCDAASWACSAFSYWRGRCWLCEPGTGIRIHDSLVGTKYYTKVRASIPGETCIGDSVAADQRYTGEYICKCAAGFVGENCQETHDLKV